jgi:hypothetical protein
MTYFAEADKAKGRSKAAKPFTIDFTEVNKLKSSKSNKGTNALADGLMEFAINMQARQFTEKELAARNKRFADTFKNAKPSKASGAAAEIRKLRDGAIR